MLRVSSLLLIAGLTVGFAGKAVSAEPLDDYVKAADHSFAWEVQETVTSPAGTVTHIRLTSQTWHDIKWVHSLRIYEPAEKPKTDVTLLFITGGSTTSKPSAKDDEFGFGLAKVCGARVAALPQVPNQPLYDGKTEDTLIAETFVRYLDSHDATWPLLFPMVKSAVRAMDTVQAWAKRESKPVPEKFVVTGASKRGWTTWLTGASDARVLAIAPMVIDTLNMKAQLKHSRETWGQQSEQIDDYTSRGLTEQFDTEFGSKLWKMVDPFSYRDRLTMPKLMINGANDPYWTIDALNLYWDELRGPKAVVFLPNAGHGLDQNRDYATHGIGALFRHAVAGRPFPAVAWTHSDGEDGHVRLTVQSQPAPKAAKLWVSRTATKDFRKSPWEPMNMTITPSTITSEVMRPKAGHMALFGDLTYEVDGLDYHLSTQVRVVPGKETAKPNAAGE